MFYYIFLALVYFMIAVGIFVFANRKKDFDSVDVVFALFMGFIFSIFWFITIPFTGFIAFAWLISKCVNKLIDRIVK